MQDIYEIRLEYTDGTDELLLFDGEDVEEAAAKAHSWADIKREIRNVIPGEKVNRYKLHR